MKKDIQRKRTIRLFIDSAVSIIEEEGFDSITIRKVADKAGYNSATLYNYFRNLDHLKALTALTFITDYTVALDTYVNDAKDTCEVNSKIWECFYKYSYESPNIFFSIFGNYLSKDNNKYFKEFYDIYPDRLVSKSESVCEMLVKENIYDRSMILLQKCAKDGFFREEDLEAINEMTFFIYRGMITKLITQEDYKVTEDEFVKTAMEYTNRVFESYKINPLRL